MTVPARRLVAAVLVGLALAACARETGDFGRAKPNALDDEVKPWLGGMIARHGRDELVSDFNRTDREGTLRDRAWAIVRAPHVNDWFGHLLVEGERTRILPEIDSRFDPAGYYAYLRRDPFRSSEARWNRLMTDLRADTALVGPFWGEARRVREDDRQRLSTLDGRSDVRPEELRDAYARIDENARVVDWVWRALRFRRAAYRIAIDRMEVETPTDRLWEANRLWEAFGRAIETAEADFPAEPRRTAPGPARRSRYSQGAGIQEVVPQK